MAWLREKVSDEEDRAGISGEGVDRIINLHRMAIFHRSKGGGGHPKPSVFVIPYDGARPERFGFGSNADAEAFMEGLALILETNIRKVYTKKDVVAMGRAAQAKAP